MDIYFATGISLAPRFYLTAHIVALFRRPYSRFSQKLELYRSFFELSLPIQIKTVIEIQPRRPRKITLQEIHGNSVQNMMF